MNLLGVAVLELDSYPDHNKGPDPCNLRWSIDPSYRPLFLAILQHLQQTIADKQPFDCTIFELKS